MRAIRLSGADPARARDTEWLLTNGLGGFAMGTVLGANTRRYHGLLVAATAPPLGRVVALHSMIDQLVLDDEPVELSTHEFGGGPVLHPDGYARLSRFLDHMPDQVAWAYRIGPVKLIKSLRLPHGRNEAELVYELRGIERPLELHLRPMVPLRDFHAPTRGGPPPGVPTIDQGGRVMRVSGHAATLELEIVGADAEWSVEPDFWRDFAYREDRARGQEWHEDVWSPGMLRVEIDAPGAARVTVRATVETTATLPSIRAARPEGGDTERTRLLAAADQFVVGRSTTEGRSVTIIAGYPWFADWGRDAMISLPGLLLTTGRRLEAIGMLRTFAEHLDEGIIPNRFDDHTNEPHYNTVDASLWFVNAVRAVHAQVEHAEIEDLVAASWHVIEGYRKGFSELIRMDDDGLIAAGTTETQLTWMDARRDGIVFTPRHGKAVEINALWYNALRSTAEMIGDRTQRDALTTLADRVRRSFRDLFWWADRSCCHDVLGLVDGQWRPDGRLRPNQILAVSLPHSPLTSEQQHSVVSTVGATLLTPYGLRTLDPAHEDYRGRFEGDMMSRDSAYHQGTVWPWLLGPYGEAMLRVDGFGESARHSVRRMLDRLLGELDRGCLGQIAEVYDGDPPHRPGGCPAQAWSVAEVLRLLELCDVPTPVA